ncbi:MAG: hypothetical protein EU552_00745 [Promethearchaeota archaeon]|jgi:hypothetical protein|nr:MAG: hypothetical protein EU552_00745 [Candidatus Lokiarchaeota archaeon]
MDPQFVGMVFESIIIICASTILVLILLKYMEKRHRLTLYLLIIFLFYTIAIIFSWLSKVLILYSGIDFIIDRNLPDPGTAFSWIIYRIIDFRISFLLLSIAIYLSYVLKVKVFEKGYNSIERIIVILTFATTFLCSLFLYEPGNVLLDAIAFLLIFIFMAMIYFPFMFRSYQSYKLAKQDLFKKAFLSLCLMSLFFILVPFNFLIDRLTILAGGPGFTIFYFLAWIFVFLGIIGAYFGYIRPRTD